MYHLLPCSLGSSRRRPDRALWLPRLVGVFMLVAVVVLLGCHRHERIETPRAEALAELRYPADAEVGPSLDVLAETWRHELHLINRTARTYRDMQLWLNREYVREVERVRIGEGNYFDLRSFVNRWQEPYPIGWLLAPERRLELVHAELYDPEANVRYPLHARGE